MRSDDRDDFDTRAPRLFANFSVFSEMADVTRYIIIGYLATWTMFLLTRWRRALPTLDEELRYYLID